MRGNGTRLTPVAARQPRHIAVFLQTTAQAGPLTGAKAQPQEPTYVAAEQAEKKVLFVVITNAARDLLFR